MWGTEELRSKVTVLLEKPVWGWGAKWVTWVTGALPAGVQMTCIFTMDRSTWATSGALGAPWGPRWVRERGFGVTLGPSG